MTCAQREGQCSSITSDDDFKCSVEDSFGVTDLNGTLFHIQAHIGQIRTCSERVHQQHSIPKDYFFFFGGGGGGEEYDLSKSVGCKNFSM